MKRMHLIIVAVVIGFALGGLLAVRHARRTAATVPPVAERPAPSAGKTPVMDAWQSALKADTRTDYSADPAATKRLMEKLRQEELRQRPPEGRN